MKLFLNLKRIKFQSSVLTSVFLWVSIFLLSGQMNVFANDEWGAPAILQARTVQGVVTDGFGEPLPGVNITIKGTTTGVMTDSDGSFSITVPNDNDVLVFSYIGFVRQEILVANQTVINLTMKEDTQQIEEVVITGYGGTRSRSKLTNSISKVKEETLSVGVYGNPAQALSGAVSGLRVIQNSGDPMATPSIILRGGTNLDGSGSPLILIDGMIRGSLRDINPSDIESIEVLKDAGATAIYGARANNGVILVTTKSGKAGKAEIVVDTRVKMDYLNNPYKMLNARDYLYWIRNSYKNAAQVWQDESGAWRGFGSMATLTTANQYGTGNLYWDPANPNTPLDGNIDSRAVWSPMILSESNRFLLNEGWQTMIDPIYGDEIIFKEFNMEDAAFRHPALTQNYNISLSGGHEKGHYYAGLGYHDAEFLPIVLWYRRLTGVFNGDFKINNWLTSFSSLNYAKTKYKNTTNTGFGSYFGRMLSAPPTMRGTNTNGELLVGVNSGDGNPQKNIDAFQQDLNWDNLSLGQSFKIDIIENLTLKLNASLLIEKNMNETFTRDYLNSPNTWVRTRNSAASINEITRQMYNAIASYKFSFANHQFDILGGAEYYDDFYKAFSASGSGAPTDDFANLGLTSTDENRRSIASTHWQMRILSYMGRLNYDYADKYLLSATFRSDGYSLLLNNRQGFFPGVSGGWVFSKESFMENTSDWISFAKLRASYGVNGNVSGIGMSGETMVNPYELQGAFGTVNYNGNVGYNLSTVPNPNLRWERSNTFEVGLDISFLENRMNANLTWYNRITEDKFANIPLPGSSGITTIRSNNGTLQNRGLEADFNFKILNRSDWTWNLDFNLSHYKNKILKLPDNGLERNRQGAMQVYSGNGNELIWVGGYQEGQRPGDIYAYKALGIFKNEAEVAAVAGNRIDRSVSTVNTGNPLYGPNEWNKLTDTEKATALPIQAGDVNWLDVNGDGVIDIYDKVKMGNTTPTLIGGIINSISYKGFGLYARFDYALGHYQHDEYMTWFMGCAQGTFNGVLEVKDTWTVENPNAKYPKYYWADQNGKRNYYRSLNSMFVYNASYLNFREVALTYDLKKAWLQKIKSSGIQISITGQNLGYLTKSKAWSPEIGGNFQPGYSIPRSVIFGTLLKF